MGVNAVKQPDSTSLGTAQGQAGRDETPATEAVRMAYTLVPTRNGRVSAVGRVAPICTMAREGPVGAFTKVPQTVAILIL